MIPSISSSFSQSVSQSVRNPMPYALKTGWTAEGLSLIHIWNGVFAPVLGHRRLDLFHLLRRQLGAALQRLVLAVVGIDRFHHGLLRLHSLQLFCELFHGKVIVGADTCLLYTSRCV